MYNWGHGTAPRHRGTAALTAKNKHTPPFPLILDFLGVATIRWDSDSGLPRKKIISYEVAIETTMAIFSNANGMPVSVCLPPSTVIIILERTSRWLLLAWPCFEPLSMLVVTSRRNKPNLTSFMDGGADAVLASMDSTLLARSVATSELGMAVWVWLTQLGVASSSTVCGNTGGGQARQQ